MSCRSPVVIHPAPVATAIPYRARRRGGRRRGGWRVAGGGRLLPRVVPSTPTGAIHPERYDFHRAERPARTSGRKPHLPVQTAPLSASRTRQRATTPRKRRAEKRTPVDRRLLPRLVPSAPSGAIFTEWSVLPAPVGANRTSQCKPHLSVRAGRPAPSAPSGAIFTEWSVLPAPVGVNRTSQCKPHLSARAAPASARRSTGAPNPERCHPPRVVRFPPNGASCPHQWAQTAPLSANRTSQCERHPPARRTRRPAAPAPLSRRRTSRPWHRRRGRSRPGPSRTRRAGAGCGRRPRARARRRRRRRCR